MTQNRNILKRKVGETISMKLEFSASDFLNVTSVTSTLKKVNGDFSINNDVSHVLSVAADNDDDAYSIFFNQVLSSQLTVGRYALDVRIAIGNEIVYTDTVYFDFSESVT